MDYRLLSISFQPQLKNEVIKVNVVITIKDTYHDTAEGKKKD